MKRVHFFIRSRTAYEISTVLVTRQSIKCGSYETGVIFKYNSKYILVREKYSVGGGIGGTRRYQKSVAESTVGRNETKFIT